MVSAFEPVQGGCFCGEIRYQITAKPKIGAQCFCRDCQYFFGGGPQAFIMVPVAGFVLTKGELKTFKHRAASGNTITRHSCAICATPVFNRVDERSEDIAVSIGTLDNPSQFAPRAAIWTGSAPDWAHIDPDLHQAH